MRVRRARGCPFALVNVAACATVAAMTPHLALSLAALFVALCAVAYVVHSPRRIKRLGLNAREHADRAQAAELQTAKLLREIQHLTGNRPGPLA